MKNLAILFLLFCIQFFGESKLIVLRHGEGEHNLLHVLSSLTKEEGGTDHSLTEAGKAQVTQTAQMLLNAGINKRTVGLVLVSPLLRTRQTAQILIDTGVCLEEHIQIEPRIREQIQTDWEGMFVGKIPNVTPSLKDWNEEAKRAAEHGAESLEAIQNRLNSVLQEIANRDESKGHVILVMHGYTGMVLLELCGEPLSKKLTTAEAKIVSLPRMGNSH